MNQKEVNPTIADAQKCLIRFQKGANSLLTYETEAIKVASRDRLTQEDRSKNYRAFDQYLRELDIYLARLKQLKEQIFLPKSFPNYLDSCIYFKESIEPVLGLYSNLMNIKIEKSAECQIVVIVEFLNYFKVFIDFALNENEQKNMLVTNGDMKFIAVHYCHDKEVNRFTSVRSSGSVLCQRLSSFFTVVWFYFMKQNEPNILFSFIKFITNYSNFLTERCCVCNQYFSLTDPDAFLPPYVRDINSSFAYHLHCYNGNNFVLKQ